MPASPVPSPASPPRALAPNGIVASRGSYRGGRWTEGTQFSRRLMPPARFERDDSDGPLFGRTTAWNEGNPLTANDQKAVIFDMDGVLIDSYRAHFESWRAVAAEHHRVYSEEQFAAGFGRTSREVIAEQWQGEPLSDERIGEIDRRKEWLFREIISADFPAMAGAVELM